MLWFLVFLCGTSYAQFCRGDDVKMVFRHFENQSTFYIFKIDFLDSDLIQRFF